MWVESLPTTPLSKMGILVFRQRFDSKAFTSNPWGHHVMPLSISFIIKHIPALIVSRVWLVVCSGFGGMFLPSVKNRQASKGPRISRPCSVACPLDLQSAIGRSSHPFSPKKGHFFSLSY